MIRAALTASTAQRQLGPVTRRASRAGGLIACLALAACGASSPSPPGPALHVENRIATAVVLSFSILEDGSPDLVVPACGGSVELAPGVDGVPRADWVIVLSHDPSGGLDLALDAVGGDPSQLPEIPVTVYIMWSTGELQPASLPRWLTITPTGVIESAAPLPPVAAGPCAPWAYPLETVPPD
jgi:hypothetical protein